MNKPTFRAPAFDTLKHSAFIGFDSLLSDIEGLCNQTSYPPHNVYAIDDNNHIVELALAGFEKHEVVIEVVDNLLVISAKPPEDKRIYLHHGISRRKFEKKFKLSPDTEVSSATFTDGLLQIRIHRLVTAPVRQLVKID